MIQTAQIIMEDVAKAFGVTVEDLRSHNRKAPLADARAITAYLFTRLLHMSSTESGKILNRNHASILHNVHKVEGMKQWPKMFSRNLNILKSIEDKYFNKSNIKPNEVIETKSTAVDEMGG